MYKKGRPVQIQTATQWNLIGRSMMYPSPVLSPRSILPLRFSHCGFIPTRKNAARVSKMLLFGFIFYFLQTP
jgi:hypothetical protein